MNGTSLEAFEILSPEEQASLTLVDDTWRWPPTVPPSFKLLEYLEGQMLGCAARGILGG